MQATTLPDGPIAEKTPADPQHAVWALLESVKDPEIPVVSLREMGILRIGESQFVPTVDQALKEA